MTFGMKCRNETHMHSFIFPFLGETDPGDLLNPVNADTDPLIEIGGDLNEWLNITGTLIAVGAASTSNGLYVCEVCLFRGTAFEECHLANTSLQVIGGPPILEIAPDDGAFNYSELSPFK